jgi:hypothetical protein
MEEMVFGNPSDYGFYSSAGELCDRVARYANLKQCPLGG